MKSEEVRFDGGKLLPFLGQAQPIGAWAFQIDVVKVVKDCGLKDRRENDRCTAI